MKCNLTLHCGAKPATRVDVYDVPTPASTRTWHPIPHFDLLCLVENILQRNHLRIVEEAHSLTHDGTRYFGLLQVENGHRHDEFSWVLGLRNTHDKTFSAGIVTGTQVFVCDNLSFSGEVRLSRKHTKFILRDLPQLTVTAIQKLLARWYSVEDRYNAYRDYQLSHEQVHDLLIRAVDTGVCPVTTLPYVLNHWREPKHEVFAAPNAWSLFNAFTEALKGHLHLLPQRTIALHGMMDSYIGIRPQEELFLEEVEA